MEPMGKSPRKPGQGSSLCLSADRSETNSWASFPASPAQGAYKVDLELEGLY